MRAALHPSASPYSVATRRLHLRGHAATPSMASSTQELPQAAASTAVDLFTICERLKRTPRAGWVRYGVPRPESVADHTFRMAFMAFVVSSLPGYDAQKCVKMALVHDLAEALVGDITPHDGVTKAEKHAREEAAMTRMQLTLTGAVQDGESSSSAASASIAAKIWSTAGDEMLALWQEYEMCASPEALLLKDLDKLEMIMQAYEYEQATGQPLDEFFRSTAGAFLSPVGIALSDEVRARRAKLAEEQSDSGAAKAARTVAAIGDDLADLGQLGDGFGA